MCIALLAPVRSNAVVSQIGTNYIQIWIYPKGCLLTYTCSTQTKAKEAEERKAKEAKEAEERKAKEAKEAEEQKAREAEAEEAAQKAAQEAEEKSASAPSTPVQDGAASAIGDADNASSASPPAAAPPPATASAPDTASPEAESAPPVADVESPVPPPPPLPELPPVSPPLPELPPASPPLPELPPASPPLPPPPTTDDIDMSADYLPPPPDEDFPEISESHTDLPPPPLPEDGDFGRSPVTPPPPSDEENDAAPPPANFPAIESGRNRHRQIRESFSDLNEFPEVPPPKDVWMSDVVPGSPMYDHKPRKYSADPDVLNRMGRQELTSYMKMIHLKAQQLASIIANTKRDEYYHVTISRDSPQSDFGYSFISIDKNAKSDTGLPKKKRKSQRFTSRRLLQDFDVGPDKVLMCTRMSPEMSAGIFSPPVAKANREQYPDSDSAYATPAYGSGYGSTPAYGSGYGSTPGYGSSAYSGYSSPASPAVTNDYTEAIANLGSSPKPDDRDESSQLHTGTLNKRAIKSAKNWTKRHFVLYPQKLCYFKGKNAKKPAGTYHICSKTEVGVIINLSLSLCVCAPLL